MTDEKAANSHLAGLPAAARCEIAPVGVKVGLGRSNAGKPCITSLFLVLQAYKLVILRNMVKLFLSIQLRAERETLAGVSGGIFANCIFCRFDVHNMSLIVL